MKLENNAENKAKFFALYLGQEVLKKNLDGLENFTSNPNGFLSNPSDILYLSLTHLSQITKKDAIDVFDLLFSHSETHRSKPDDFKASFGEDWANSIFFDSYGQYYPKDYIQMIDFLRSKGYALPFMGISIETLIEWGWIKLKES